MAEPLVECVDYEFENGLKEFTRAYHLKRGYCCQSGCRHCPYGFNKDEQLSPPAQQDADRD